MTPKPKKKLISKVIAMHPIKPGVHNVPQRIAIPMSQETLMIDVSNIVYFKSESNYTHIHFVDGSHLMTCMTLKLFDEHLRGGDFLRIHNQYLVHGKYLSSFISGTNTAILSNKQQIPVSRNRKSVLLDYLKSYMIQTS